MVGPEAPEAPEAALWRCGAVTSGRECCTVKEIAPGDPGRSPGITSAEVNALFAEAKCRSVLCAGSFRGGDKWERVEETETETERERERVKESG